MNTLSRAHTARLFATQTEYRDLCKHWRRLVNSDRRHQLTGAHHLLYLALLGRDWRKAFTFPTNSLHLANGAFESWGFFNALHLLHSQSVQATLLEPFDGLVTPEMLQQIRLLIPWRLAFAYKQSDYAPGQFPFEAYLIPDYWQQTSSEAPHV
jgi:hypothetical protein